MTTEAQIEEFLRESNAIEGVYDKKSLEDSIWAWGFLNRRTEEQGGINPYIVMQVHEIIMRNRGAWSEPELMGKYRGLLRDCPVYIGGQEAMYHGSIGYALEEWCNTMNILCKTTEEMSRALHVQYEKIHPFIDGNGRTGRMFMNWERLRDGLPLLIIHEGKEQMEYYKWFKI